MRTISFLLPSILAASSAAVFAQQPATVVDGWYPTEEHARSVAFCGDVDADGWVDLIFGAPDPGSGAAGIVRVYSGADGSFLHLFSGIDAWGEFGFAVAGAGDVDADGHADLIVGAPFGVGIQERGRVRVFSGADGSLLHEIVGASEADLLGYAVSGLADIDGDGFADFAVGIPGFDAGSNFNAGAVNVYSGLTGNVLYTAVGNGSFGEDLAPIGDLDGDGLPELIVGAWAANNLQGSAHVRSGADGSPLLQIDGNDSGDSFARSIGNAGDVNGDGFEDIVVGASGHDGPSDTNLGRVDVFSGVDGARLASFEGDAAWDLFGESVAGAGDLDGDGFADLLVGSANDGSDAAVNTGQVFVISVRKNAVLWTRDGEGGGYGRSLAGGVDVNGGGAPDILVGASSLDVPSIGAGVGRAYLYSPRDLMLHADPEDPRPGDPVVLTSRGGDALVPAGMAITALDGLPTFLYLGPGRLDARGRWERGGTPSPALSGLAMTIRSWALRLDGGGAQLSNPTTIRVQ